MRRGRLVISSPRKLVGCPFQMLNRAYSVHIRGPSTFAPSLVEQKGGGRRLHATALEGLARLWPLGLLLPSAGRAERHCTDTVPSGDPALAGAIGLLGLQHAIRSVLIELTRQKVATVRVRGSLAFAKSKSRSRKQTRKHQAARHEWLLGVFFVHPPLLYFSGACPFAFCTPFKPAPAC